MKIALIWPESTFLIDPMVYPPLGLWHVWGALHKNNIHAEFFDLSDPNGIPPWVVGGFDQYWFSGTTPQSASIKKWVSHCNEEGLHTVVGGPHATIHPEEVVEYADVVAVGEVTNTNVTDIIHAKRGVVSLGRCDNMLDVALPVRSVSRRYHATLLGSRCTTIMTSWGCPYSCAFCSSNHIYGSKVRYLPLDYVLQDLNNIQSMGFGAVQFYDDILPIARNRTLRIANHLGELGLLWRCFMRSDLALMHGFEFFRELAQQGLTEILVGVESGSDIIKRNINKRTTIAQDTQLLEWCKKLGVRYKASVILGLPGETWKTMEATARWLLDNRPNKADVNVLIPMPGTPLYDNAEEYDCNWTVELPDNYFFKGKPDNVEGFVSTSELTSSDITTFRDVLISQLRELGVTY